MSSARVRGAALLMVLAASASCSLMADGFDYANDFGSYGTVANFTCPLSGICAAVEVINSFTFLDTQYPSVYSSSPLIPGNDPNRDALWFAKTGWNSTHGHRDGYYQRTGGDPDQRLLQTKQDWVNDFSPGTTLLSFQTFPTLDFLAGQIKDHEDVELIVEGQGGSSGFAHALGLTLITCSDKAHKKCAAGYQDPNDPTHEHFSPLFMFPQQPGELGIAYPGVGNVVIRSALAESPVPEPAPGILCGIGLAFLLWRRLFGRPLRCRGHY